LLGQEAKKEGVMGFMAPFSGLGKNIRLGVAGDEARVSAEASNGREEVGHSSLKTRDRNFDWLGG